MPVSSIPSGMSAYGAYHFAGNVSEWCLNRYGDGMAVTGGDFNSPTYAFGNYGAFPPLHSSSTIGFRCARTIAAPRGDQGGFPISRTATKVELKPVGDAEFAKIAAFYDYPDTPLNARVVERQELDGWTKEKIEFDGFRGERATAFLYLPKNAKPPYQLIHFVPASDVDRGVRSLDASMEAVMGQSVRQGRALFAVVLRGYIGRPSNSSIPSRATEEWADWVAERITDLRRGLDYLHTRPDVDKSRIVFFGPSAGGSIGIILAGLEDRYRAVGLMGVGIGPDEVRQTVAKASRVNFASRMRAPKLLLHGRWDEAHPLEAETMPLFALLPEPKELVVADSGHIPPKDVVARVVTKYFDEQLGKPRR